MSKPMFTAYYKVQRDVSCKYKCAETEVFLWLKEFTTGTEDVRSRSAERISARLCVYILIRSTIVAGNKTMQDR